MIITRRWRRRIANDRLIVVAEIAGKEHAASTPIGASARDLRQDHTRPENVARSLEAHANTGRDLNWVAFVRQGPEQLQRSKRIVLSVKRQSRLVSCQLVAIAIVGIFFLQSS